MKFDLYVAYDDMQLKAVIDEINPLQSITFFKSVTLAANYFLNVFFKIFLSTSDVPTLSR